MLICGTVEHTDRGWNILVASDLSIKCCAPLASSVRRLLAAAASGDVPVTEAAAALQLQLQLDFITADPVPVLPAADDELSIDQLVTTLRSAAPAAAVAAASGRRPRGPSASPSFFLVVSRPRGGAAGSSAVALVSQRRRRAPRFSSVSSDGPRRPRTRRRSNATG